nr:hypothetical protein [Pandoravirus belohorizontensis]
MASQIGGSCLNLSEVRLPIGCRVRPRHEAKHASTVAADARSVFPILGLFFRLFFLRKRRDRHPDTFFFFSSMSACRLSLGPCGPLAAPRAIQPLTDFSVREPAWPRGRRWALVVFNAVPMARGLAAGRLAAGFGPAGRAAAKPTSAGIEPANTFSES